MIRFRPFAIALLAIATAAAPLLAQPSPPTPPTPPDAPRTPRAPRAPSAVRVDIPAEARVRVEAELSRARSEIDRALAEMQGNPHIPPALKAKLQRQLTRLRDAGLRKLPRLAGDMEAYGEAMEAWSEEFGREMEQWGEELGEAMERKAEEAVRKAGLDDDSIDFDFFFDFDRPARAGRDRRRSDRDDRRNDRGDRRGDRGRDRDDCDSCEDEGHGDGHGHGGHDDDGDAPVAAGPGGDPWAGTLSRRSAPQRGPGSWSVTVEDDDLDLTLDIDLDELQLDGGQRTQLKRIATEEKTRIAPVRVKLRELASELRGELADVDTDDAEVNRLIDAISAQESQLRKARINALTRTRKVLSAAQRAQVDGR